MAVLEPFLLTNPRRLRKGYFGVCYKPLEVYKYTMDDKGNITTTQIFTKHESGHSGDLKKPETPITPQNPI